MNIEEDLKFILMGEFTTVAVLDDGSKYQGIFDEESVPDGFDGTYEARRISFCCDRALPIVYGSELTIKNKRYRVTGSELLDDGLAKDLILEEL